MPDPTHRDTLLRQWEMLQHIPRHPAKITATEIHDHLVGAGYVVTKRTVERDLEILSAPFPLQVDARSKPYGWSWKADASGLTVPGLSVSEALTFRLVEQHLRPLLPATVLKDLKPYFDLAATRLTESASGAQSWTAKVRVVAPTQTLKIPPIDAEIQRNLYDALLKNRQVKIRYQRPGEKTPVEYQAVDPLGLVQRGAVLYLVATVFGHADPFLLVLHRMKRVECLEVPAIRPRGFDLDAYIASGGMGFGGGGTIRLELLLDSDAAPYLAETPLSTDQRLTPARDGRTRVRATLPETEQLRWWILGFGEKAEVLKPAGLRRRMAATARGLAVRYRVRTG